MRMKKRNTFSRRSKNVKKRTKTDKKLILCKFTLKANPIAWLNHFFSQIFQKVFSKNIAKYCETMFFK